MPLKAILIDPNGNKFAEKEFVAVARLPRAVYLDGAFCILKRIQGTQGIYQTIHYYRFPETPIEEDAIATDH
ncbi:hypothetical protein I8752_36545 [Nostocaceae cyanobacterium CENA369]|uniref:Uncharacterized protein n=1 Tax=Dendronalium phyllosphericum CENA369 TaxID=1725256 RepID=A0A8J7I938_9NOST|nr:hypothetical protein [Dendronalium phyllosphericum]MBH8578356.1 hypothetical protein [Dendronalium phyllosphericum CENA369]